MDHAADIIPADRTPKPLPLCPRCGYDLGLRFPTQWAKVIQCPECGAEWNRQDPRLTPWPGRLSVAWRLAWPCVVISLSFPCMMGIAFSLTAGIEILMLLALGVILAGGFWPLAVAKTLADRHTPELERRGTVIRLTLLGVILNVAILVVGTLATIAVVHVVLFMADYP